MCMNIEENIHTYIEKDDNLGANIHWKDAICLFKHTTYKDTCLEFIHRPGWGIACYMNGCIQSCESDETYYHAALVQPCFTVDTLNKKLNVCIFGGGEGATAREVLQHSEVDHVTMIEWDNDVIKVFQTKFPQWARGAWNDSRLEICIEDAFTHITSIPKDTYDIVILDLFEPEEQSIIIWKKFLLNVYEILQGNGTVAMYAGMYNFRNNGKPQDILINILTFVGFTNINMKRIFIPSFLGEACFIFATKIS